MFNLYYVDVRDFYTLRLKNFPTVLKWDTIKHLNTPFGNTIWQSLDALADYDASAQPTTKQLLRGLLRNQQLITNLERIFDIEELEISRGVTSSAYELSINDHSFFYSNQTERDNDYKLIVLLEKKL